MKLLFALLLMATPALADSNILRCQVAADGVSIPEGSYVELDPSGPFLTLYRDYSRKSDGPIYYVKADLVSNSYLSSWRVERSSPNCVVSTGGTNSTDVKYRCADVNQFLDLQGFMNYDSSSASGYYSQNGLTANGSQMMFEFKFFGCQ